MRTLDATTNTTTLRQPYRSNIVTPASGVGFKCAERDMLEWSDQTPEWAPPLQVQDRVRPKAIPTAEIECDFESWQGISW